MAHHNVNTHGKHPEWHIVKELFPAEGTMAEQLTFLLQYAILAPSAHNSQPWLFEVRDDTVRIFADRARRLYVVDPHDREMTIACASAGFALRMAMRRFELDDLVCLLPDRNDRNLLVSISANGRR